MKILTFNHHEPYLTTLGLTGHQFDVVVKKGHLNLSWSNRTRAVPQNFQLIEFDKNTRKKLRQGGYDVVICHTIKNLIWLWWYFKPSYIFVAHIPLYRHSLGLRMKSLLKKLTWSAFKLTHRTKFFAVSEFKSLSWGEKWKFAVLAPSAFPPLRHTLNSGNVLIVCNNLKARGEELGLEMITRLARQTTICVVGNNPGIDYAIAPRDFDDFKEIVTGFRIYLYTIKMPWGDGYNTAMLEAMRMGMAVVTVENPTSPIIHGKNGLVGRTEEELLAHINLLRSNPSLAERLGEAAKETIKNHFTEQKFIDTWREVIEEAASR